jgi:hypothetical protein
VTASQSWLRRGVPAVVARPTLWPTALVQLARLAAPGWWRHRPFLPLPDPAYLRFRLQTMYGDPAHEPVADDLVTYLEWCRRFRRVAR